MEKTIYLRRLFRGADSSLGALWLYDQQPECFIIEDEYREIKVAGETRIPAGRYEIKKRITESSEMTLKYREQYAFFDYHLQLQDVPGFSWIYIHAGNKESHTDGCLLVNYNAMMIEGEDAKEYVGGRSRDAFKVIYKELSAFLDRGQLFIEVID